MIRKIAILVLLLFFFQNGYSQDGSKLTVPASPAFSILNFEPSSIMRPTDAKELAADVLNSFDKDGKILLNLGLEASPYWWKSHSKLTRENYLNPYPGQAFCQSFSLSAATVKDSVSGNNKFGVGFRFKLFNGHPVEQLAIKDNELINEESVMNVINMARGFVGENIKSKKDAIDFILTNLHNSKVPDNIIGDVNQQATRLEKTFKDSSVSEITLFLDKLEELRAEGYKKLGEDISGLLYERKGFVLEFAGATGFNASKKNELERYGAWINGSYFVSPDDLFTVTARYMFNNNDSSLANIDAGLSYLKKTNKYNVSVEALFRHYRAEINDININNRPIKRVEKDFTYRFAAQASYMISKDISINLSFGKDFDSPFVSRSGFFSILGFNYSIFSKLPAELN
jgi:hypothetical protein